MCMSIGTTGRQWHVWHAWLTLNFAEKFAERRVEDIYSISIDSYRYTCVCIRVCVSLAFSLFVCV